MAEHKLNITDIKILETIALLNSKNYYPLTLGVHKIVNGIVDEDTFEFRDLPTFSTLISIKGRQIASKIHQLVRYNYLSYKHNKEDDRMYLRITFKGETNLEDYKKHHKISFKKNTIKEIDPCIVLIKD